MAWTPIVSEIGLKDQMTRAEVKSIFMFVTRQWVLNDGTRAPITVVLFEPDTFAFKQFSENVLTMHKNSYAALIEGQESSGAIPRLIRVRADVQMRQKVANNSLAIGYLNDRLYVGTPHGIKFIEILD